MNDEKEHVHQWHPDGDYDRCECGQKSKVDGGRAKRIKTGGRKKGTPNKATADARAAMASICQNIVGEFEVWLRAIDDPAERCNVFLRALEFHVPKLNRTIFTGGAADEPVRILVEGIAAGMGRAG